MAAEKRSPWFKFYSRDWRGNAKLRLCSFAARGLWIDLLSLMWEASPRGFLLVEGVAPTPQQLTGLIGGSTREIAGLLKELAATNVYSVTGDDLPRDVASLIPGDMPQGVILSRRMVRDEAKAERDKANGGRGGSPRLKGVNPQANPQKSETRDQKSESQGSNNHTVAEPTSRQGGARARSVGDLDEDWPARMRGYRPGRFWNPMWGPRPESGQSYVPAPILAAWKESMT